MAANPYLWSTTAATNASSDAAINWAEGQNPSTVNDSSRNEMAGIAGWLKDTNSTLTTAGTANVQTVTTNLPYAALATGLRLHLRAGLSNTAAFTLNVTPAGGAAFGAKAVKVIGGGGEADPTAGQFGIGGHYILEYDAAAASAVGAWILLNPSNDAFTTGDVKPTFKTTADAGWVMMDDGSIGNASSSATARASADTVTLFTLLYNNIAALVVQDSSGTPVSRGANAAADYAANRRLVIPATLGRALAVSGSGSGLTSRTLGEVVGEESHALSIAELATHAHSITDQLHTHSVAVTGAYGNSIVVSDGSAAASVFELGSALSFINYGIGAVSINTAGTGITTTNNNCSGTAHNIMQPSSFLNVMIKL